MACVNHSDRESAARCVTCGAELCDECRTEVDGKNYCAKHVPAAAATTPPAGPIPVTPAPQPAAPGAGADDPSQEQPVLAALSYIIGIIISIVILVTDMKKSRYMRFHAWHSLFWAVACMAIWIAVSILGTVLAMIPFVGILAPILFMVVGLGELILAIVLAVKAYNKDELVLPLITQWARDQTDKMQV